MISIIKPRILRGFIILTCFACLWSWVRARGNALALEIILLAPALGTYCFKDTIRAVWLNSPLGEDKNSVL